ncbi:hypothetical protein [Pseudovibrio sp. Tun.PSC04-5.I4]|uniref:hypothetical protein n=1 Tax=Pseudovibrio sp. Tun.PSC04-5.I4 TaxID=1798213 RepID=UPI00088DE80F|nr:hypothetical protein [Pseudovibrio sp. Tun.PSC04-5.I4]SDR21204.1 hypothetical protein SAMN04515695_3444 [Pseudovibrio sp. Tun.PSC04-5.I4]
MRTKIFAAALLAFSIGYTGQINLSSLPAGASLFIAVGAAKAQTAPRNTARRTSRRTSRRVNRRQSVAGCRPYNAYFNCGGVYYRPVVENGVTVYVVVNP